ncbi:MAG: hypothetical protein AB1641_14240 [Thermodesulfobacteriota bacterium]
MKRKRQGLAAAGLLTAALAVAVVSSVMIWSSNEATRDQRFRLPSAPAGPGPILMAEMEKLEPVLAALAAPEESQSTVVNLGLFGPQDGAAVRAPADTGPVKTEMDYAVTLAFASPRKSFCVVNGVLYAQGATLPDGGRILHIESKRVYIDRKGVGAWAPVVSWHVGSVKTSAGKGTAKPKAKEKGR